MTRGTLCSARARQPPPGPTGRRRSRRHGAEKGTCVKRASLGISALGIAALALSPLAVSGPAQARRPGRHRSRSRRSATAPTVPTPRRSAATRSRPRRRTGPDAKKDLHLGAKEALQVKDVLRDADGAEHVRYERTYDDLPVVGGDLVVAQTTDGDIRQVDWASPDEIKVASTQAAAAAPDGARKVVYAADHGRSSPGRPRSPAPSDERHPGPRPRLHRRPHRQAARPAPADRRGQRHRQLAVQRHGHDPEHAVRVDLQPDRRHPRRPLDVRRQQLHLDEPGHAVHRRRQRLGHRHHLEPADRGRRRRASARRRPGTSTRTPTAATASATTASRPTPGCTTAAATRTPSGTTPASA